MIMVLTYIPEREAGCRTNKVTLRLTDSEMDWLREAAWTSRMSQAEFIRSRVFRSKVPEVPQELKELLHRLFHQQGRQQHQPDREERKCCRLCQCPDDPENADAAGRAGGDLSEDMQ